MMLLNDAMLPLRCREFRRMCAQGMSSEDRPLLWLTTFLHVRYIDPLSHVAGVEYLLHRRPSKLHVHENIYHRAFQQRRRTVIVL
jgi:hypothetical protein